MSRSQVSVRERVRAGITGLVRRDWGRGLVLMNDGACSIPLAAAQPGPSGRPCADPLDDQA